MKNPRNLLIFAFLGGIVGTGFGLLLGQLGGGSTIDKSAEAEIRSVMDMQAKDWNAGDIESFMNGYFRGEELRFASGGRINTGWQPTLEGYLSRYPDRATMGELAFTDLDIDILDADDALVFGRWALQRETDRPNGLFTLHFRKIDGDWLIVSDHTSTAE